MATLAAVLVVSLACMVWAGPLTISLMQAAGSDVPVYRLLTSTVPYKYIGFSTGGLLLVFTLIAWITGRAGWRALVTAIGMTVFLIVLYDVPFDTLLLPPNGSQ